METKERILKAALAHFAQDGFEAASMSAIAKEIGITKGALYRHYRNKRAILEAITRRMEQKDSEFADQDAVPKSVLSENPSVYEKTKIEALQAFSRRMFRYWTADDFAASFRRLLTLEQYRSAEMQMLYQQYLATGPMNYVADILSSWGDVKAKVHAASFYGALFLLYSAYDAACDDQTKRAVTALADRCIVGLINYGASS